MQAAWYESRGPAREVLVVGTMLEPQPAPGEVRIRLAFSGISPGDVKKRGGWQGAPMPYPRVIPHSDGAGVIDAVGVGVPSSRIGQTVWCYGAQSYRPFGTAAESVIVPSAMAVSLPEGAAVQANVLEQAACLGITGITGYQAVFAAGPVNGLNVLVWGAGSGVGAVALQMARRAGARVMAVVRRPEQQTALREQGVNNTWLADDPALITYIKQAAPEGVHRVAEVDFAAHIDTNAEIMAIGGVIAAYYSSDNRPSIPYWKLGFSDVSLRLLGSDDFAPQVKERAAEELTKALMDGSLSIPVTRRLPLTEIALAHEHIEQGFSGRVVLGFS
ncbi:NADPH:quinone reductase [Solimicrobium silvestre]|uniref:NADPH:quinone reductase and related Zn-dependent oxidoreductase n=1 Tax=Solimicrobium silvestre TaxID=2099400 RepID=A0A2S9H3N2_9BURK|nr:NADPH:quinone reductase [Solimicrobium silvestre]PRC94589.1 NADPH:quinone reductase and related Zn-dependent oxidoreductase [Solimicrobium silvestre]